MQGVYLNRTTGQFEPRNPTRDMCMDEACEYQGVYFDLIQNDWVPRKTQLTCLTVRGIGMTFDTETDQWVPRTTFFDPYILGQEPDYSGCGGQNTSWVLETGIWDNTKYWCNTCIWKNEATQWILQSGIWNDNIFWCDPCYWNDVV